MTELRVTPMSGPADSTQGLDLVNANLDQPQDVEYDAFGPPAPFPVNAFRIQFKVLVGAAEVTLDRYLSSGGAEITDATIRVYEEGGFVWVGLYGLLRNGSPIQFHPEILHRA